MNSQAWYPLTTKFDMEGQIMGTGESLTAPKNWKGP